MLATIGIRAFLLALVARNQTFVASYASCFMAAMKFTDLLVYDMTDMYVHVYAPSHQE